MSAMKRIAIALERGAQLTTHDWKFVENRSNSLQARVAYAQLLNEYVVEFARTLDTADHAVDAIESPHDYAGEIASWLSQNRDEHDEEIAALGRWECADCDAVATRMDIYIDEAETCIVE